VAESSLPPEVGPVGADGAVRPGNAPSVSRGRRPSPGTRPRSSLIARPEPDPERLEAPAGGGPKVVALGGGHGLAVVLRAVRLYSSNITAVVSVADDGGSSGRLRADYDIPAPGDLRKALIALASDDSPWREAFEYRFAGGEIDGHALGNLMLVGLAQTLGDFTAALAEAGRVLQCVGQVLPATPDAVVLKADIEGESVEGQVAVASSRGRIRRVELVPDDAPTCPEAVDAIRAADQIIIAPGSLFTSVLPVLCVHELRAEIEVARARVVQIANLRAQAPETTGLDATDHLRAVLDHGGRVDALLYQNGGRLAADDDAISDLGVLPAPADVARSDGLAHDPSKLAKALKALL
jgi:uncharacterized cofD-like protein